MSAHPSPTGYVVTSEARFANWFMRRWLDDISSCHSLMFSSHLFSGVKFNSMVFDAYSHLLIKVGKGRFRRSVQDRRPEEDRTEVGPRLVRPILWDRRSRFGPVDRPSVGLWTSLTAAFNLFAAGATYWGLTLLAAYYSLFLVFHMNGKGLS